LARIAMSIDATPKTALVCSPERVLKVLGIAQYALYMRWCPSIRTKCFIQ
jgi:hypothetical protein